MFGLKPEKWGCSCILFKRYCNCQFLIYCIQKYLSVCVCVCVGGGGGGAGRGIFDLVISYKISLIYKHDSKRISLWYWNKTPVKRKLD